MHILHLEKRHLICLMSHSFINFSLILLFLSGNKELSTPILPQQLKLQLSRLFRIQNLAFSKFIGLNSLHLGPLI